MIEQHPTENCQRLFNRLKKLVIRELLANGPMKQITLVRMASSGNKKIMHDLGSTFDNALLLLPYFYRLTKEGDVHRIRYNDRPCILTLNK